MDRFESLQKYIAIYQERHKKPLTDVDLGALSYLIEREWLRTHEEPVTDAEYYTDGNTVIVRPLHRISTPLSYEETRGFVHDVLTRYGYETIEELYKDLRNDIIISSHKGDQHTKISLAELKEAGRAYEAYCFETQTYFPTEDVAAGIIKASENHLSLDQINILLFLCQCEAVYQDDKMLFTEWIPLKDDMINFITELPSEEPRLNERAWRIIREVVSKYANKSLLQLKNIVKPSPAWQAHRDVLKYRAWLKVVHKLYQYEAHIRRMTISMQSGLETLKVSADDAYSITQLEDCVFDVLVTPKYALHLADCLAGYKLPFITNGLVVFDNLMIKDYIRTKRFTVVKVAEGHLLRSTIWETDIMPNCIMRKTAEFYKNLEICREILLPATYDREITSLLP